MHAVPDSPLPLLTWPCFDPTRVQVAVTTRAGGVSSGRYASLNLGLHVGDRYDDVLTNRTRVAAALGRGLDDMVFCQQVHGNSVMVVDAADRGRGARDSRNAVLATDAVLTTTPEVVLVVLVADCVPIVLHDPVGGVLACVHAGWRGTVGGVIPAAVERMCELGASRARIVAAMGPAIAADAYQVGGDVADGARDAFGTRTDQVLRPDGTGRHLFDLPAAALLQLTDAELSPGHIHQTDLSTGPDAPFYSHRGEAPAGRFGIVAALTQGVAA